MFDPTYIIGQLLPSGDVKSTHENPEIVCMYTIHTSWQGEESDLMDIRIYRTADVPMERVKDEFFSLFLARIREYPISTDVSVLRNELDDVVLRINARIGGMQHLEAVLRTGVLPAALPCDRIPFNMVELENLSHFGGIGEKSWDVIYDSQYNDTESYHACVRDFFMGKGEKRE